MSRQFAREHAVDCRRCASVKLKGEVSMKKDFIANAGSKLFVALSALL